jgi:hypothetical protein
MTRLRTNKAIRRVSKRDLRKVAQHFDRRAKGTVTAAELSARMKARREEKGKTDWTSEESVRASLELSHAINESGRFTEEQYFFHCAAPVESLHDHRWMEGHYKDKLDPISAAMRAVETKYGLTDGQYWPRGAGSAEYTRLSAQYDRLFADELAALFRKFGLERHARLKARNRTEYDRLREAGRAHVFDRTDVEHATAKLIDMYEAEAKKCVKAKAFHAACVMLGSACESLILLKCIREPAELAAAQARIPKSKGFHKGGPSYWNLGQLVEVAKLAGWVADLETANAVVQIVNLLGHLQGLRNLVHAGRHAADMPHISVGKEQYEDAWSAYLALKFAFEKKATAARAS